MYKSTYVNNLTVSVPLLASQLHPPSPLLGVGLRCCRRNVPGRGDTRDQSTEGVATASLPQHAGMTHTHTHTDTCTHVFPPAVPHVCTYMGILF